MRRPTSAGRPRCRRARRAVRTLQRVGLPGARHAPIAPIDIMSLCILRDVRQIREFIFIIRESSRQGKVRHDEANIRRESEAVVNDRCSSIRTYISDEF